MYTCFLEIAFVYDVASYGNALVPHGQIIFFCLIAENFNIIKCGDFAATVLGH